MINKIIFLVSVLFFNVQAKELSIGNEILGVDYILKNIDGNDTSLGKLKKSNGILVVFSCNTCPWVIRWQDRYNILSAFSKNSIGLKKIPPPIPTIPEIKPKKEPIVNELKKFNFFITIFLSSYDLLFISNNIPAIDKTKNSKISKNSFLISKDPPRKAKGIEPIINGKSNLKLLLPALT